MLDKKFDDRIDNLSVDEAFELLESITYRGMGEWKSLLRTEILDQEEVSELKFVLADAYIQILRVKC